MQIYTKSSSKLEWLRKSREMLVCGELRVSMGTHRLRSSARSRHAQRAVLTWLSPVCAPVLPPSPDCPGAAAGVEPGAPVLPESPCASHLVGRLADGQGACDFSSASPVHHAVVSDEVPDDAQGVVKGPLCFLDDLGKSVLPMSTWS